MWKKRSGTPFVLKPNHAALFRTAARMLSDEVGWDEHDETSGMGMAAFDSLTQGQKQTAILAVARALLDPVTKAPKINAALAATIDTIYRHLNATVQIEIEVRRTTKLRQKILDAMDELEYWTVASAGGDVESKTRPAPDCDRPSDWSFLVLEVLLAEILEDADFAMSELMDLPPDQAAKLKRKMNIDPDYFVAVVEDPTPARRKDLKRDLRLLLDEMKIRPTR